MKVSHRKNIKRRKVRFGYESNSLIGLDFLILAKIIRLPRCLSKGVRLFYVGQSEIPGASEALFANCEIETGTIAAFYNGSRADPKDFDPSTWETNNYK